MTKKKTDSSITYHKSGTVTLAGPDATAFYRAVAIAKALTFYSVTGCKINRAYTPTAMLAAAKEITGKTYKRGQYQQAADDLMTWARELKAALPQIEEE